MRSLSHCIDEVCWEEVRKEVAELNFTLAALVDQVEPGSELKLFRVRYPFGAYIFQQNQIQIPIAQRKLVPMSHHSLPSQMREQLGYSPIPLAFLMNKKIEVFTENRGGAAPLDLIHPGELLGLWEFFEGRGKCALSHSWQMTAGCRSVFFLSQIANEQSHRKLKMMYQVKSPAPKKLAEHWHVFREIAQSSHIECDWHCELLFVSQAFIKAVYQHPNYLALKNYLMEMLWEQTRIWRNRAYMDVNWETLSTVMALEDFKTVLTYMPIIRRLFDIGNGLALGFRPAIDETALPLKTLQTIYLNDYGLKEYAPVIMQPHCSTPPLSLRQPVYFSLLFPAQLYHKTKSRHKQSMLNELREVIHLNEAVNHWMLKHNYLSFVKFNQLRYEYFHSDSDALHKIRPTSTILQFDDKLASHVSLYSNRKFPEKSSFLRGSVLILKE